MIRWVVGSIIQGGLIQLFLVSAMIGVTKSVVYATVYGMVHIKDPLLLIGKSSPCSGVGRFPLTV